MNMDTMTNVVRESLVKAFELANNNNNPEVCITHLLKILLSNEEEKSFLTIVSNTTLSSFIFLTSSHKLIKLCSVVL